MPLGFPQYPAGWDAMPAAQKVSWVKDLSASTPANIAKNNAWLKEMSAKFGTNKVGLDPKTAINAARGNQFFKSLADRQKETSDMVKKATKHVNHTGLAGAGALVKGALTTPLGATASLGSPVLAGILGALAIYSTKKKHDREIDTHTTESGKRHEQLMKMIRAQRKKNPVDYQKDHLIPMKAGGEDKMLPLLPEIKQDNSMKLLGGGSLDPGQLTVDTSNQGLIK